MARTRGVALCPYLHVRSMHARTSVALTCPSATHRSLSMGISIAAWQQQHGGLRLPRSVLRGLLLFERSEFLIDTSQKKSLRVCTRARVHACSTSLGFSIRSANRIWPKHGIPLPV